MALLWALLKKACSSSEPTKLYKEKGTKFNNITYSNFNSFKIWLFCKPYYITLISSFLQKYNNCIIVTTTLMIVYTYMHGIARYVQYMKALSKLTLLCVCGYRVQWSSRCIQTFWALWGQTARKGHDNSSYWRHLCTKVCLYVADQPPTIKGTQSHNPWIILLM